MQLLDGKKASANLKTNLALAIDEKVNAGNREPKLVVILVGNDPSSQIYVRNKAKACMQTHIKSEVINLDENITSEGLEQVIQDYNSRKDVDAILLQLPLPKHLDDKYFIQLIDQRKDVDGFHAANQGKIMEDIDTIYPCTPLGIIRLLEFNNIDIKSKNVCVVGTSTIVGRPLAMMMLNEKASVDMCNINTSDLKQHTLNADIIISATGVKHLITADMVKDGVVVVDVGMIRDLKTNKLSGDVDFDNVSLKAS